MPPNLDNAQNAALWLIRAQNSHVPEKLSLQQRQARAAFSEFLNRHNDPIPISIATDVAAELNTLDPSGFAFDDSMLLRLVQRDLRARTIWALLLTKDFPYSISAPNIAPLWSSSQNIEIAVLLDACTVTPINDDIAKLSGIALDCSLERQNRPKRRFPVKRQEPGIVNVDQNINREIALAILEEASLGPSGWAALSIAAAAVRGDCLICDVERKTDYALLQTHFFTNTKIVYV